VAVHDVRCREVVELVTDFLEGALARDRRDVFERHLAMCAWCQTYMDQMRVTLEVTGRIREDEVPPELVDSLAAAFRLERSGGA
jgi:predicted anti-sigma-YlaC factor YlaD